MISCLVKIYKYFLLKDKSKANQLTCAYFKEIEDSLEKLLLESKEKCADDQESIDYLRNFYQKFLLIVSRVAGLLECLEFDPLEFCHMLDAAEEQAKRLTKPNIPIYVISNYSRLGIDQYSSSSSTATQNDEDENSHEAPFHPKVSTVKINRKSSLLEKRQHQGAPTEADFEQIKLISNGAYGAVHLVRYRQHKTQRFAMKKIKKHNLILRNQLQQVFTERDIMTFTDNPFVVSLICTFETKK